MGKAEHKRAWEKCQAESSRCVKCFNRTPSKNNLCDVCFAKEDADYCHKHGQRRKNIRGVGGFNCIVCYEEAVIAREKVELAGQGDPNADGSDPFWRLRLPNSAGGRHAV